MRPSADYLASVTNLYVQLNLSTTVPMGTETSGRCGGVALSGGVAVNGGVAVSGRVAVVKG